MARERISLGLTRSQLARLLGVEAGRVVFWERERLPLPISYRFELAALGVDTARLALGAPGAWLPGSDLPDERLLRYCWQGLAGEAKAGLRAMLRRRVGVTG